MPNFRYAILFCNCLLIIGVAFNSDLISVLISTLQRRGCQRYEVELQRLQLEDIGVTNVTCCMQCLGLTPLQYNTLCGLPQFFGVFAAIFTGVAIDHMGYCKCAFYLAVQAMIGISICTVATIRTCHLFVTSIQAFGMLLVGRILFVMAICGLVVTRNFICGMWFAKDKLTTALGISIAINSLGNALNFLITAEFASKHGMTNAFILGVGMCSISVLGALGLAVIDWISSEKKPVSRRSSTKKVAKYGGKLEADVADVLEQIVATKIRFSSICSYPAVYWATMIHFVLCTACVWPFLSNACKFVEDIYSLGTSSSVIVGSFHFTCLFALPLIGYLSDKAKAYGSMGIVSSSLFVLIFFCLIIRVRLHPVVWFVLMGIAYAVSQTNSLTIIFRVSTPENRATAAALTAAVSLMVNGLVSVCMGLMLTITSRSAEPDLEKPWGRVLPTFEGISLIGLLLIIVTNIKDFMSRKSEMNPCLNKKTEVEDRQKLAEEKNTDYGTVTEKTEKDEPSKTE